MSFCSDELKSQLKSVIAAVVKIHKYIHPLTVKKLMKDTKKLISCSAHLILNSLLLPAHPVAQNQLLLQDD